MLTEEEAKRTVLARLNSRGVGAPDGVVITEVIARPYGWAFLYNSRRFIETQNAFDSLVGAGPVVVIAETGEIHELGSIRRAEEELAALEERLSLVSSPSL